MSEGIAIIGMARRFPGATTIDQFWRIVREGGDALTDFSEAELLAAGVSRAELADNLKALRRVGKPAGAHPGRPAGLESAFQHSHQRL